MFAVTAWSHAPPNPVVPFALNIVAGSSLAQSAGSIVSVALAGVSAVYVRGDPLLGAWQPTQADTLNSFSLQLYVLVFVGVFVFYLMMTRDRNLQALEEARSAALANAAAISQKQQAAERFVSALSFDLRTPLNVIGAVSERLSELHGLSAPTARRVRIVQSAADMLLNIIGNMVDAKSLEHGRLLTRTEPKPIDLISLVRNLSATMAFYAHRKRLKLRCRVASAVPRTVSGDPLRLQRVLVNLVQNAIRCGSSLLLVCFQPWAD
jgi:signal transduction histidine kinase